MVAFGYIVILGVLAALVLLCFIWGVFEYKKPRDPGPLFIDLDRTIDERSEALALRRGLEALLEEKGLSLVEEGAKPSWLAPCEVLSKVSVAEGEIKEIWSVKSGPSVPEGAKINKVLVVNGDLKTGNDCIFDEDVYVIGSAVIGDRNHLKAITTRGDLTIGGGATVKRFADADGELKIGDGSAILGSATSASLITVGSNCKLGGIYSPAGYMIGEDSASAHPSKVLTGSELSEVVLWNPKMDELIKERFGEVSIDELGAQIKDRLGVHVPAKMILRRARMLGLVIKAFTKLNREQKPRYLESASVWMQDAETIRVRGDVRIPEGDVVPYNMIVDGNFTSEDDVTFQGGLHIKGRAVIGARNRLQKSIVCQKDLVLLEDVIVNNCIDCEGLVLIKKGARIGVGVEGGGIVSASTICLEEAKGVLKVYSRAEIRTVEFIKEEVPGLLRWEGA